MKTTKISPIMAIMYFVCFFLTVDIALAIVLQSVALGIIFLIVFVAWWGIYANLK